MTSSASLFRRAKFALLVMSAAALAESVPAPLAGDSSGEAEAGSRNITKEQMIKENTLGKEDLPQAPDTPIETIKPNADGKIETKEADEGPPPMVQMIMDSSGSMGQLLAEGKTKMFFSKKLLTRYMQDQWQEKATVGLRVYGSRRKGDCSDDVQMIKFGDKNLYDAEDRIAKLFPVGRTPLNDSISESLKLMKNYKGPKRIVIFTDGEETCGGDPCKTAEEVRKELKLDVKIFLVAIGFKPNSDALKKVSCIAKADTMLANDEEQLFGAMGAISDKVTQPNLKVVSPLPTATVMLYKVNGKQRTFFKSFSAAWGIRVPPGEYEAVVYLEPKFKFEKFTIPPKKTVTLRIEGKGTVTVNFMDKLMNVEVLDPNSKVITEFKSVTPTAIPTGKWKLRIFKPPFFEHLVQKFMVYPAGMHTIEAPAVGIALVDHPEMTGVYVYDGKDKLLGNGFTNFPMILKSGEYKLHLGETCTIDKVNITDERKIKVFRCEGNNK